MSQRSVTGKIVGTAVIGLVCLVVFAGLLVGTVNGYSDIAILAQNIGRLGRFGCVYSSDVVPGRGS